MEPISINISIPFRLDGNTAEHPGCLKKFSAAEIYQYMDALKKEIASTAEDGDEVQVQEINFVNGSLTHIGMDLPKQILKQVQASFQVIPDVKINIHVTPAALDFFMLNCFRQLGKSFLTIEIPTLEKEGLASAGYESTRDGCLMALDSCFQNAFRSYGCELNPGYFCTPDGLRDTLSQMLARKPLRIGFVSAPAGEYAAVADELLSGAGYQKDDRTNVWFHGAKPATRHFRNQLGFGPYAISVADAQAVRTTGDFAFYLAHSDDFEALVMHDSEG